ncbi:MetQ/NlpA family ABC transporter substrate-binding protein [Peribacillus sp. NPDC097295]|uniref:MetQ/NlpA family ABC transporter substrate-binding protein n=1 Tax=Peribacillus sp. NPDC097295 TaxID=3364402 RepID=UPI00381BD134
MKKITCLLSICALSLGLSACGNEEPGIKKPESKKEVKIGATTGPNADMAIEAIQPGLEDLGYKVDIVEYSDCIQPNKALANGTIDANLFQHKVYMDNFAQAHALELSDLIIVPSAPMGIYSKEFKSLATITDEATIAIPDDPANLARALNLLLDEELIEVDPEADPLTISEKDITKNPKNIVFKPLELTHLPRATDSVDLSVIPGNFAIAAKMGLQNALVLEDLPDTYQNVVAVNTEDIDAQFAKDIQSVVKGAEFEKVIESKFPSFEKPEWMR